MSFGDEIMASGHARVASQQHGRRVQITDKWGKPRWCDLWVGLAWIVQPGESEAGAYRLANASGCRPYIDYRAGFTILDGCRYTSWRAQDHRGAIAFTSEECAFAESAGVSGAVLIEPNLADGSNPNKQWGKWAELVALRPDLDWIQVGPAGTAALDGVHLIETETFRIGAAVLARVRAAVLPEGGLHHAAAAVDHKRIVTLIGCAPSAHCLAYPEQVNFEAVSGGCGTWKPQSPCCSAYWSNLKPEAVMAALEGVLE